MFQQSIISKPETNRKPLSLGLSLLSQSVVLALLAVLPLLYSPGLPTAQLRTLLLAPPPPLARPSVQTVTQTSRILPTTHNVFRLTTIQRIPHPAVPPTQIASAPVLGGDSGVDASNGLPNSLLSGTETTAVPPPPPPPAKPTPEARPQSVRIGGAVAEANLIQRVQPVYPPLAKTTRVSGTVEFSATISRDGRIENLQLLHGHPLLIDAAKQAILQWRYKPTLLNGVPVEVITSIVVTFRLN